MTVEAITVTSPLLIRSGVDDDTDQTITRLTSQLGTHRAWCQRQTAYYQGSTRVRDLGIAIPPHLVEVEAVAAWPEIVVDVLHERMDWISWYTPDADLGLDVVAAGNDLPIEFGQALLDALITGVGFLVVGTGDQDAGEPDVLVTVESPERITGTWSRRQRRLVEAWAETYDADGNPDGGVLYLPDETITVRRDAASRTRVVDRDQHGRGRVPVSVIGNRATSQRIGRSEITRAVRSLTESGMRTLLGMEITREFYGAPQRYLMGADEQMFVDVDGNRKTMWEVVLGKLLVAPRDEEGDVPTPGVFPSASPQPFTELLKTYAQMISAASGVPATHLGFATDNPTSADAIREANSRLDKRAVRRRSEADRGLVDVARTVLLWRDGKLPEPGAVRCRWSDPSTPTPAAASDRAQKLIASGTFTPRGRVTLDELGLDDTKQQQLADDWAAVAAESDPISGLTQLLTAQADTASPAGDAGGQVVQGGDTE
ncbi:MAG: phage portal protein [Phycicoccus sp.]